MRTFTFVPSSQSASRHLLLTAAFCMMPFLALPAQQPEDAKFLKIVDLTPRSPGKLAAGEKLTLEIRCTNPQKDPVLVFASAYTQGRVTGKSTTSGAYPSAQGESMVSRWISFNEPAQVDEIQISMVDAADQRKSIAKITVPVQLAWAGEVIPAKKPPRAARPPASQKALRLTLVGYEVSQDAASALYRLPPAEFAPDKLLASLVRLTAKGAAQMVKLPELDVPAGEDRGVVAPPVNGYQLEGLLQRGGGSYVQTIYSLSSGGQVAMTNRVLTRIGQPVFLGSASGTAEDKSILIFARISEIAPSN